MSYSTQTLSPVCLPSVYLTSLHVTKSPSPPPTPPTLFLHTESNSKTGAGENLRMRLVVYKSVYPFPLLPVSRGEVHFIQNLTFIKNVTYHTNAKLNHTSILFFNHCFLSLISFLLVINFLHCRESLTFLFCLTHIVKRVTFRFRSYLSIFHCPRKVSYNVNVMFNISQCIVMKDTLHLDSFTQEHIKTDS